MIAKRLDEEWRQGRVSLGAAARWTAEEVRLVAELGYALAGQGRYDEALILFEGLAALAPATPYFQSALGALKLRLGRHAEALTHLNNALAANPADLSALVNRGEAYLSLGNYQAAINSLRAAISLPPDGSEEDRALIRARALLACYV
ncbi:MAG: tetratricopeptide repeat protein [Blastocatellia bacterium]